MRLPQAKYFQRVPPNCGEEFRENHSVSPILRKALPALFSSSWSKAWKLWKEVVCCCIPEVDVLLPWKSVHSLKETSPNPAVRTQLLTVHQGLSYPHVPALACCLAAEGLRAQSRHAANPQWLFIKSLTSSCSMLQMFCHTTTSCLLCRLRRTEAGWVQRVAELAAGQYRQVANFRECQKEGVRKLP